MFYLCTKSPLHQSLYEHAQDNTTSYSHSVFIAWDWLCVYHAGKTKLHLATKIYFKVASFNINFWLLDNKILYRIIICVHACTEPNHLCTEQLRMQHRCLKPFVWRKVSGNLLETSPIFPGVYDTVSLSGFHDPVIINILELVSGISSPWEEPWTDLIPFN